MVSQWQHIAADGLMQAENARLAAVVFQQARGSGELGTMDSDYAAGLAITAAGNPYASLRALGHDTEGMAPTTGDTYRYFMDEYYESLCAREHMDTMADVQAEEAERSGERLAAIARFCPEGEDGVKAAFMFGDESALRKYEESLCFA